jgi:hypothetical protein
MAARIFAVLLGAGLAFASVAPAFAASAPVNVRVNMARILRIDAPAATVIVGNPGVADVTIQDPQTLVLTGKSFGQTNLIILDGNGNPIADTMIEVTRDIADVVTVYNGAARQSYSCEPECQSMVMLGDDAAYTKGLIDGTDKINGFASGN